VASRRAAARAGRRTAALILLAALALLAVADWLTGGITQDWVYGTGTLVMASNPDGAQISIDGEARGVTPATLELRAGTHRVLLRHPYHPDAMREVTIGRGTTVEVYDTLAAASGVLTIASNPKGARVVLNGTAQPGITPMVLDPLPAGQHEVVMQLKGRTPVTVNVEVLPGRRVELARDLEPARMGVINVTTTPGGARATLIDAAGERHAAGTPVPVGRYALEVTRTGYHPQNLTVRVNAPQKTVELTLVPITGTLTVRARPADARITVARAGGRPVPYTAGARFPAGPVTLEIRAPGYRTERRTVQIGDGPRTVEVALRAIAGTAGDRIQDALRGGGLAPAMIVVPAGRLQVSSGGSNARVIRDRRFEYPFAMSIDEVTRADWSRFAAATGRVMPQAREGETDRHPILRVRFDDAAAYADWLSEATGAVYRLPSEAEWEYAARAGSDSAFPGGAAEQACAFGNVADQTAETRFRAWDTINCNDGQIRPAPVGSYRANAWGLRDMIGNASEWTRTCWDSAPGADDSAHANCGSRVVRGGSWDTTADGVGFADAEPASREGDDRGFRLLREL
jgi:formylglycine-generating enzyme required for sulfatase activity